MPPRARLKREEREKRVRIFVEQTIAGRGRLPTIAEVLKAVGGSSTIIASVLREYRAPNTTEDGRFLKPFDPTKPMSDEEYAARMEIALQYAERTDPIVIRGTLKRMDISETMRLIRSRRYEE